MQRLCSLLQPLERSSIKRHEMPISRLIYREDFLSELKLTESDERQLMLRLEELARIEGLRSEGTDIKISSSIRALIDNKASENDVIKKDGSVALTNDWDIGDTRRLLADVIRARDSAGLNLGDDSENGIFIKDGGYVGIGTNNPNYPFVAYHAGLFPFLVKGSGSGTNLWDAVVYAVQNENNTTNNRVGIHFWDSAGSGVAGVQAQITNQTTHSANLYLWTRNASGLTEHIIITSDGNVGIGTQTPSAKLAINGGLHVSINFHNVISSISKSFYPYHKSGSAYQTCLFNIKQF